MAAIISSVGVAILGAASSYFAYQKKKLCFKVQGGEFGTFLQCTNQNLHIRTTLVWIYKSCLLF